MQVGRILYLWGTMEDLVMMAEPMKTGKSGKQYSAAALNLAHLQIIIKSNSYLRFV